MVRQRSLIETIDQAVSSIPGQQLERACLLVAVGLGAIHAWAARYAAIDPDTISYLDMADAFMRGDWKMAINAYWSPLYSWLVGLALSVVKPSPYWEYSLLHVVSFLIYLWALFSFRFFWLELRRYHLNWRAD